MILSRGYVFLEPDDEWICRHNLPCTGSVHREMEGKRKPCTVSVHSGTEGKVEPCTNSIHSGTEGNLKPCTDSVHSVTEASPVLLASTVG